MGVQYRCIDTDFGQRAAFYFILANMFAIKFAQDSLFPLSVSFMGVCAFLCPQPCLSVSSLTSRSWSPCPEVCWKVDDLHPLPRGRGAGTPRVASAKALPVSSFFYAARLLLILIAIPASLFSLLGLIVAGLWWRTSLEYPHVLQAPEAFGPGPRLLLLGGFGPQTTHPVKFFQFWANLPRVHPWL